MNVKTLRRHVPKVVCVSSGKGGVGKTSFSVNLAAALADSGARVLLIDGDLGLANVDVVLGLNVHRTLRETVQEGRDPGEVLVEISPRFSVLPASSGVPEMASPSHEEQAFLTSTLEKLLDRFDFVLVDTAAGLGETVLWFNNWAGENLIILSPDPTAMTDAYALIKVLGARFGKTRFQLVINQIKSQKEGREVFHSMQSVLKRFLQINPLLLGTMPQDGSVAKAIRQQQPFLTCFPECRASEAIRQMAGSLMGSE